MTTHEQHIAQMKKEIEKIERKQARLAKQMHKLAALPYKRPQTLLRRIPKFLSIYRKAQSLEIEKQIIISMPLPKRETGGVIAGNMAIFKETGPEVIKVRNLTIHPTPAGKISDPLIVISESRPIDENALKSLDLMPKRWAYSEGAEQEAIVTNKGKSI